MLLREIREEMGFSQKELAKQMGVSPTNIYNYESGRTEPNIDTLIKLSKILNVSVDYLLGLEDDLGVKEYAPADAAPGATERAMGDEAELLRAFRKLSPFARSAVMVQVKALAEDQEELPVK